MTPGQFAGMCRKLPSAIFDAGVETLHNDVGNKFREAQEGNFGREADQFNSTWPPRKHSYPWPILRKTKRMMRAASQRNAPGNIQRTLARRLVLGISNAEVPYAKFHQYGTSRLPVRRFFYLRSEDRPLLRPPIRSHLLRVFQSTKGRFNGR